MREPSSTTRIVRCAAAANDLDFLIVDNAIAPSDCDYLTALYREDPSLYETWHRDPFWQNRLLGHRDITPAGMRLVRVALSRVTQRVADFYSQLLPLYVDVLHLVGWPTGWRMEPHADNAHANGERHEFHWRDFSGVIYLNDDYEGGGLYLPHQDILIKPRKGTFVSLPCGLSHLHGVTEVTSGQRVTMAFFLTIDRVHADAELMEAVDA